MAVPKSEFIYTIEEYLAMERESEERHIYLDGYVFEMAGESPQHGMICSNLTAILVIQLRGTPCQTWSKDTKVRSGLQPPNRWTRKGLFSYPDLVVVCGEAEYHDEHRDVLINPKVVIEVLSESTEAFDSGEKFRRYQKCNSTLTDYLLVAQSNPVITHLSRQADGGWSYYIYEGLEESLRIESINCTLHLAEVYDRIDFPAEDEVIEDQ
jgi:Uma2 family endonuclease